MSGSRTGLRFKADSDSGRAWKHPYDGLPVHIVDQITHESNPHTKGRGIVCYFNHFHTWEGPVAEGAAAGWILSGATGTATIVHSDTPAGAIILTADATAGATPTLARGGASTGANMAYAVGRRMWVFMRFKLATVAATELFFGVATPDTAPCVTSTFPSDGLFFDKASAATKVDFHARKDGTSTERLLVGSALVDDTYTELGFMIDELGGIMPYQDGLALTAGYIPPGTANIPATSDILQPIIGILCNALTATIDYVLFAQEL